MRGKGHCAISLHARVDSSVKRATVARAKSLVCTGRSAGYRGEPSHEREDTRVEHVCGSRLRDYSLRGAPSLRTVEKR